MRQPQFMRSNTFHWALMVAGVFAIFVIVLFGFIYWKIDDYLTARSDRVITAQLEGIAALPPERRLEAIDERLRQDPRGVQLAAIFAADGHRITGNLESLPSDLRIDAEAQGADIIRTDRNGREHQTVRAIARRMRNGDVLVLSALGAVDDRVRGLRMGGDDYLTKPFAVVELVARIEALLRRPAESRETILRVGPLELDLIERTAKRGDRAIDLLPREFRLLEYMMQRSDQLLTRAMLLEEVWNYKFVPATNLVDVHMGRLRHKVDGPDDAPMIHNVRGAGFILRAGS